MVRIVESSVAFEVPFDGVEALRIIERAARTSYLSEPAGDAENFVRARIKQGHLSVLEHVSASARFVVDRGVSHELVRHRLCAITQESTRFVSYAKRDLTFVRPYWCMDTNTPECRAWLDAMQQCEVSYLAIVASGQPPQAARAVLPNSLKTELVITANLREWRHILEVRASRFAHPDMRKVADELLRLFIEACPAVFDSVLCS